MARVKVADFKSPGLIQDIPDYDIVPEAYSEGRNVRFNNKGVQAIAGYRLVMSAAPITPLWLKVFPPVDAPKWVYGNLTSMRVFDSAHEDITRLSGPYTGVANERWTGDILNGVGIFNNTVDVPQLWSSFDASVRLIDLPNWPSTLRVKSLRPFGNFLIALYTIESGNHRPYRFRWSHPAAPGTYPSSWALGDPTKDSGEKDIAETEDYLVDGLKLGNLFMIYKQRSVYASQWIGKPDIFAHWNIISGKGLLWRDCVVETKHGHLVAGLDDIYLHQGIRGTEESVVEGRNREWIFNQIDADNFFNCYMVNFKKREEIWFCFPEAGETYPTLAWIFNTRYGGIGIRDIPRAPFITTGPVDLNVDDDIWDS